MNRNLSESARPPWRGHESASPLNEPNGLRHDAAIGISAESSSRHSGVMSPLYRVRLCAKP